MPPTSERATSGLYGRLVATRPQGASKYRSMRSDLALFDASDLYEYACPVGMQDPRLATNEQLIARTEERMKDYMRNTSERSATERLCSRARELFNDDVERRRYDEYLQWCELKAVFDDLDERLDPSKSRCAPDEVAQEIVRLRELLGSRSQAEALMESFLANRGIAYEATDSAADEVSTPQGRAQVRQELEAVNFLPDSALRPSTPEPRSNSANVQAMQTRQVMAIPPQQGGQSSVPMQQVVPGYAQQPIGYIQQPMQVGVVRRCVCGNINPADQAYCQNCGRLLQGTSAIPPVAQQVQTPPPPAPEEKKTPVFAIVAVAVAVIAVVALAAFFIMDGAPSCSWGSSSLSSAGDSKITKRVTSGAVNEVPCSATTHIVPLDADEEPITSYRVNLVREVDNKTVAKVKVHGPDGFSIRDVNDWGDAELEDVQNGTYKVSIVSDSDDERKLCEFTMSYRETDRDAADVVEVLSTR